jgi:hypothetical protein
MASKSIPQWCKDRGFSRSFFYVLDQQGRAPKTRYVNTRRIITDEDDAEWERSLPDKPEAKLASTT